MSSPVQRQKVRAEWSNHPASEAPHPIPRRGWPRTGPSQRRTGVLPAFLSSIGFTPGVTGCSAHPPSAMVRPTRMAPNTTITIRHHRTTPGDAPIRVAGHEEQKDRDRVGDAQGRHRVAHDDERITTGNVDRNTSRNTPSAPRPSSRRPRRTGGSGAASAARASLRARPAPERTRPPAAGRPR